MQIVLIFIGTFFLSSLGMLFGYSKLKMLEAFGWDYIADLSHDLPYISVPLLACFYALAIQTVAFWECNDKKSRFHQACLGYVLCSLWIFFFLLPKTIDADIPYALNGREWALGTIYIAVVGCIFLTNRWVWEKGTHRHSHESVF